MLEIKGIFVENLEITTKEKRCFFIIRNESFYLIKSLFKFPDQEVVDQESIHYLPFVKYIIVSSRKSFKINSPKFRQALKLFN